MEFYSAMKKYEILSFAGKWMELENIILSKVSQAQKTKNHVIPHMWTLDLGKCNNVVGLGSHDKGRAHIGDVGMVENPNMKAFDVPNPEELIQKP
jgi:hypothetical protein